MTLPPAGDAGADPTSTSRRLRAVEHIRRLDQLFRSPRGRIPRSTFWAAALSGWVAFAVLFAVLQGLVGRASTLVLYPPFFWSLFALSAKRYHDIGKSPRRLSQLAIPVLGVAVVAFELGVQRSMHGRNRYDLESG